MKSFWWLPQTRRSRSQEIPPTVVSCDRVDQVLMVGDKRQLIPSFNSESEKLVYIYIYKVDEFIPYHTKNNGSFQPQKIWKNGKDVGIWQPKHSCKGSGRKLQIQLSKHIQRLKKCTNKKAHSAKPFLKDLHFLRLKFVSALLMPCSRLRLCPSGCSTPCEVWINMEALPLKTCDHRI